MYATTLDKHITNYCKQFGIKKATCTNEFAYLLSSETITYTVFYFDLDNTMIELVNEKYGVDITPFYFIFSLLHEVGHHMTMDDLTQEDFDNDMFCRQVIIPQITDKRECLEAYINLTAEDLATSWAIDYIDSHIKECAKAQIRFCKIIDHIYKKKSFKKELTKLLKVV